MSTRTAARLDARFHSVARRGGASTDLLCETMRVVSSEVAFDGWCGLTLDPSTLVITGGHHAHGLTPVAIRRLLEIEYGGEDLNLFVDLARARSPAAALTLAAGGSVD